MNILLISDILFTGDLAKTLKDEGNEVKVYINDKNSKNNLHNLVTKVKNWKEELDWVGKDGLIIFEDVGEGFLQDALRKEGYTVFGTSAEAEKLELNRSYGQKIFKDYGLPILETYNFSSIKKAISFIESNPDTWVLKYSNGHMNKKFSHVGKNKEGKDVIAILENIKIHKAQYKEIITLQKRVYGIEIGVGRYFNGKDWVGPIEYNLEHTSLFPNGVGPKVDEMGTLAWFDDKEDELLYREILCKMKPFLIKSKFIGDFEINCIVNENGAFPIEATARLGSPIIHIHERLISSKFSEFFMALAKGEHFDLKWKKDYCIVVSCVTTPFPYPYSKDGDFVKGLPIFLDEDLTAEDFNDIHLDEVSSKDGTLQNIYIAGTSGSSVYITGSGSTVKKARKKAYDLIEKVHIPKMFYRHDIGENFEKEQLPKLKSFGYLKDL